MTGLAIALISLISPGEPTIEAIDKIGARAWLNETSPKLECRRLTRTSHILPSERPTRLPPGLKDGEAFWPSLETGTDSSPVKIFAQWLQYIDARLGFCMRQSSPNRPQTLGILVTVDEGKSRVGETLFFPVLPQDSPLYLCAMKAIRDTPMTSITASVIVYFRASADGVYWPCETKTETKSATNDSNR
jgi:hypothetical protein